jgi:outer membrane protein assembly factor BamA
LSKAFIIALACLLASMSRALAEQPLAPPGPTLGECRVAFTPSTGHYAFNQARQTIPEQPTGARVGTIHYTRLPIFDETNPRENNTLFRWANAFHVLTQIKTIQQELLFAPGDAYQQRLIDESGRILRGSRYLYDSAIRLVSHCAGTVDVEVITRDLWSLSPEISYDRSGGNSSHRIGIADTNLLGAGKRISISSKRDIDRNSLRLAYEDDNIRGSRTRTQLAYTESDDGQTQLVHIYKPFYALDSRRAWRLRLQTDSRQEGQYRRGNQVSKVVHNTDSLQSSYGASDGLLDGYTERWRLGYGYKKDTFERVSGEPSPNQFPQNRTLSYPFLNYAVVEDNYKTAFNLDQIHRTEDLHLGIAVNAQLGYAAKALGSDQNRLVLTGSVHDTLSYNARNLLQHRLTWYGLWNQEQDKGEDIQLDYNLRYFHSQTDKRSFFAQLDVTYTRGLNTHRQVVLGGESGARAFDSRFQTGDRRVLLTLEERQYTPIHFLNLIRVGYAAFFDIGRAWQPGVDDGIDQDLLADVGVGLRLASSKANSGSIVHIDVAFPLTHRDAPDIGQFQLAINIKNRF